MAIAPETPEEQAALEAAAAPARRRPLLVLAGLGGVGIAGILFHTFAGQAAETPKETGTEEPSLLVPDRDGPAKLEIAAADAGPADLAIPESDDLPALEASAEQLGATDTPAAPLGTDASKRLEKLQEERLLKHLLEVQEQQLELRKKALVAPSAVKEYGEAMRARAEETAEMLRSMEGSGSYRDEPSNWAEMMEPLSAMARARAAGGPGAGGGVEDGAGTRDPNLTEAKREFFANGGAQLKPGMLEHQVTKQTTPYELQMGDVIPGILISGINSESPGQIIAQVSENVCDSVTGNHLLIPQGSRLVGTYSASVGQGQTRVQVAWVRLRLPNGDKLDLGGMSGADQLGVAGFRDRVNRHFMKRLAAALMASAFTVAYEISAPRNGGLYGSAVHRGVGENIVNLGTDMAREEGRLPPTLEIRPGYRFHIMVQKDIVFPGPYPRAGRRSGGC